MSKSDLQPCGEILEAMQRRGEVPDPANPNGIVSKPASRNSSPKEKTDRKHVAAVWRAFHSWFGYRWTRAYGQKPAEAWIYGLAGLTWDQIKGGLDHVRDSGATWPPTCPEFRLMCTGRGGDDGAEVAARMSAHRALPVPPEIWAQRKAQAATWIGKCRAVLGK